MRVSFNTRSDVTAPGVFVYRRTGRPGLPAGLGAIALLLLASSPCFAGLRVLSEEMTPTPTITFTEIPERIFTPDPVAKDNIVRFTGETLREIARIRGLAVRQDVPVLFRGRDFFRNYHLDKIRKDFPPERLQKLLKVSRAMGFEGYKKAEEFYEESTKDFLRGIRGLYDPDRKEIFIAEWTDPADWEENVVHELVHALQDQHFDMKAYLEALKKLPLDERQARVCVVEGEATALQKEYMLRLSGSGKSFVETERLSRQNDINMLIGLGRAWFRGQRGRMVIEDTLGFSYAYGGAFFQELLKGRPWSGMDEVHRSPPKTTSEVIHPARYLDRSVRRAHIRFRGLTDEGKPLRGYRSIWEEVYGEYGLTELLSSRTYYKEARAATVGWRGDRLQVFEGPRGDCILVGYVLFEEASQAARFFGMYREYLAHKTKPEGSLLWDGEQYRIAHPKTGRITHLEARGSSVLFVEDVDPKRVDALVKELLPAS